MGKKVSKHPKGDGQISFYFFNCSVTGIESTSAIKKNTRTLIAEKGAL